MATLGLTLGALETGILLSSVLYGIACVQAVLYSERSSRDPIWLRAMIFVVWIFDTTHTAVTWILLYSLTITNYGNPGAIARTSWSLALTIPLTSCIGATVQVFFAWRVRVLSGRFIIPIISWTGAAVRLAFGIIMAVFIVRAKTIPEFFLHYEWLVDALLILDVAVDFLNASSLCYYLLRKRSEFKATQRIVDKLVEYTIETGLLTSLCALAVLACSLAMRDNFIYLSIFMVYPKFFSTSLFTSLNARENLRRRASGLGARGIWSVGSGVYLDTQLSDVGSASNALESGLKSLHDRSQRATLPANGYHQSLIFDNSSGKGSNISS